MDGSCGDHYHRRVPPCAAKTCAVCPIFARVVGQLRAADLSNVQGPVSKMRYFLVTARTDLHFLSFLCVFFKYPHELFREKLKGNN